VFEFSDITGADVAAAVLIRACGTIDFVLALLVTVMVAADPAGLAAWRDGRLATAEAAFRSSLRKRPSDRMTRVWLARTLLEQNRGSEAVAELQRVLTEPVPPEVRFEAGRLLRELAERRLAQLETVAPESPATLELAGERLEWTGNLDGALEQYRAAAIRDNQRPGVHYRIGNILWRKRETDAALKELKMELALTPSHGMANLRVAQVLLQSDRTMESIQYFERAVEAMPESMEARREAGKAYRKAGKAAEARAEWEAVAKARPNDDQIHYLLASLYRELGETELSKIELEKHRSLLDKRRRRD
jgi:tetratricopeptide (TPR) repeat protein